jgi:hypothetical protein
MLSSLRDVTVPCHAFAKLCQHTALGAPKDIAYEPSVYFHVGKSNADFALAQPPYATRLIVDTKSYLY